MPAQVPTSSSISMSKLVRDSSRCASSSLPAAFSSARRSASSVRISRTARSILGRSVTKCFAG